MPNFYEGAQDIMENGPEFNYLDLLEITEALPNIPNVHIGPPVAAAFNMENLGRQAAGPASRLAYNFAKNNGNLRNTTKEIIEQAIRAN